MPFGNIFIFLHLLYTVIMKPSDIQYLSADLVQCHQYPSPLMFERSVLKKCRICKTVDLVDKSILTSKLLCPYSFSRVVGEIATLLL